MVKANHALSNSAQGGTWTPVLRIKGPAILPLGQAASSAGGILIISLLLSLGLPILSHVFGFFPSFREVLFARTTGTNFFPPSSPMATCIRLPVYFLLIAWAKCFPHNLSIARQWVAIVAVKMNYNYFRLQFSPILELVMNARPLQRKSVKWCQKTAKWGLGETGRWIVCVCLPVPSESARLSFGRERTYFFTVYNYVGILTFTRSIPK